LISGEPVSCFESGKARFAAGRRMLAAKAACKNPALQTNLVLDSVVRVGFAFAGRLGPEKVLMLLR